MNGHADEAKKRDCSLMFVRFVFFFLSNNNKNVRSENGSDLSKQKHKRRSQFYIRITLSKWLHGQRNDIYFEKQKQKLEETFKPDLCFLTLCETDIDCWFHVGYLKVHFIYILALIAVISLKINKFIATKGVFSVTQAVLYVPLRFFFISVQCLVCVPFFLVGLWRWCCCLNSLIEMAHKQIYATKTVIYVFTLTTPYRKQKKRKIRKFYWKKEKPT